MVYPDRIRQVLSRGQTGRKILVQTTTIHKEIIMGRRQMKKIPIAGVEWEVHTNDLYGGGFDSSIPALVIGKAMPKMIPTIFLHEVIESILTERGLRYKMNQDGGNGDIIFVFNHKEFDNIVRDIALALDGLLNLKEILNDTKTSKEDKRGEASGKIQQDEVKKRRPHRKVKRKSQKKTIQKFSDFIDEVIEGQRLETVLKDRQG
jgi:hypothetical protein